MPNYRRPRIPGATLFVTANLLDRERGLLVRHVDLLREAVRATRAERPFAIEAWVTLPDHFHAVLRLPEGDADYAPRIAAIKARFLRDLHRSGRLEGEPRIGPRSSDRGRRSPWQPRFREHHISDAADLDAHLRYCWRDPVAHGLVDDPFDWRHSSIHRDMAAQLRRGAGRRAGNGSGGLSAARAGA